MRIGLICEGATDYFTVSVFLTESLRLRGISIEFIDLHPGLDKTSEKHCGWSNALIWLKRNNLKYRKGSILGSGLFSGALAVKKCDAILLILDEDSLHDEGFFNFVEASFKGIERPQNPQENERYLNTVASSFMEIEEGNLLSESHIFAISKQNSEFWCAGVLDETEGRCVEELAENDVVSILIREIENIPRAREVQPDRRLKNREIRYEFCKKHMAKISNLEERSGYYRKLVQDSQNLYEQQT